MQTKIELLAPAGNFECLRAAVANGADAVYFGLNSGFNARARAENFSLEELPSVIQFLHRYGVRGYVTLNTLIFTEELQQFAETLAALSDAGTDAVLLQDVGVACLAREICPELPVHASTQMTLTSAETIRLAEEVGAQRVVLARELSISEIRDIAANTDMPLEVFVHGALCVAYSGQCLTSESLGGRSANRGQCAQACRLPYEVICDGEHVDLGNQKYLLSPQDLAGFALVPELVAAGVTSLKIEGRLKAPEYVASITRNYRQAIDLAVSGNPVNFEPKQIEEMELTFSRGFSPGWLNGCDHKMLVPATSSAKRGVLLGQICGISQDRIAVELSASVKRGDGVAFDTSVDAASQGARVYEVFCQRRSLTEAVSHGVVELTFGRDAIDFDAIEMGSQVWKTDDPQVTQHLRKSFQTNNLQRQQPIWLEVVAAAGEPLHVTATLPNGLSCHVTTEIELAEAKRHPLTRNVLEEQLGRLGGTPFMLSGIEATITGNPMAPFSVLGSLRKKLIAALEDVVMSQPSRQRLKDVTSAVQEIMSIVSSKNTSEQPSSIDPTLHVMVRTLKQLEAVLHLGEKNLVADFSDIRQYREAVGMAKQDNAQLFIATPRIQKPSEMGIFTSLAKCAPAGVLVRNFSGLEYFRDKGIPVTADFSFNATNPLTVEFFKQQGVERIAVSYDCNREQLVNLTSAVAGNLLEVVIHQHMPMFHMEHCVFCSVLSPGTDKTNCGRPCDDHVVQLRDRIAVDHLLTADVGCRNTLFNAVPQSGAEVVTQLINKGVKHLRIEMLNQSQEEIADILEAYRKLLVGEVTGREVWAKLRAANRVGVTRGTLEERRNPLAIL
jgi:putative protease